MYDLLAHHLAAHANIRLNQGKTRIWNSSGHRPANTDTLGPDTWVGDRALPPEQQGLTVLGAPVGTEQYVQQFLQNTLRSHRPLLEQLPDIQDLQAAWLLLLYTASPRSNYLLRLLPPAQTIAFAASHDLAISQCLSQLLQANELPVQALARAHLPLAMGGLGLMSAALLASPAYWASWADALPVLHRQAPQVATVILQHFEQPATAPAHIQAAQAARQSIQEQGWEPPSWRQLLAQQPPPANEELFAGPTQPGWQQHAAAPVNTAARQDLYSTLDPASQAILDSQSGPFASRTFTTIPYTAEVTYPDQVFRVLMLRRLRLPLPLTERTCRCRRILDPLGDHRAACSRAGVLRSRGVPLEHAAARVCREAGARVTMHTRLNQLNIPAVNHMDDRAIEVIANGLPLWQGSQLAVDTTLVSPLTSAAEPRRRGGRFAGTALHAARQTKERTYPELVGSGRCRLAVLAMEVGGRWSAEAAQFLRLLAQTKAQSTPQHLRQATVTALISRWSAILTHAGMQAFASSLLSIPTDGATNGEGALPPLG